MTARDEALAVRIKAVLCLHCGATVVSDPEQTTVDDMDKLRQAFIDHDTRCTSNPTVAALAAERALADRLAEALVAIIGVADLDAALEDTDASENDAESKGLRALGAWRAARGKE